MISEEIDLNHHLEPTASQPVETDLGEYLIQIRNERPSHIIAPAVHLTRDQVEADFRKAHTHLDPNRDLTEIPALVEEARTVLRQKYFEADAGVTGANFLIAETGTSIIVTNEGNGDLTQTLPKVHIVIASIEKIVPTLEDAATILRVLARSATGQDFSNYTTLSTGPRRDGDPDGPEEYHVVILDNGRSNVLGTEFQDMLRCIRCGACLNHCPVYNAVGGHAYGWVYPGPIGSVVTPALVGIENAKHLPNASTFCGRCEEVCPMRIPLPKHASPLAREGVRAPPAAGFHPLGSQPLGLRRQAPEALSVRNADRRPRARQHGPRQGPLAQRAARFGLDEISRLPRSARQDLPADVEGAREMSSRDAMLARIRSKVSKGSDEARRAAVDAHMASHPRNPSSRPVALAMTSHRLRVFTEMMQAVGGSVEVVNDINDVPHAAADYLRNSNLPAQLRRGQDAVLAKLPWHRGTLEVAVGRAEESDRASITRAFAGVAESGTIIQTSGQDNPTTLNFLPEVHIVVLEAANIFASYEEAWSKLRGQFGEGTMPRTVNMISGPSRTADIEQTIVRPAHGPKNMHVIIVR